MDSIYIGSVQPSIIYFNEIKMDSDRMDAHFYHSKYINNEKHINESGMRVEPLERVILKINSPIGWQGIPSESYLPEGLGVPLIRVQNVNDLMLDRDTLIGVQEYIYQEQPAIQAESDDIIITRVGTIGRVCRIPEKISKIAMGQNLTRIKVDTNIITSEYLTVFMASDYCQLQMKRYAYGGVQPSLTNKNIKQLSVPIPSPKIQEYIGNKVRRAEELREEAKKLREGMITMLYSTIELPSNLENQNDKYNFVSNQYLDDMRMDAIYYMKKYIEYGSKLNEKEVVNLGNIIKESRYGASISANYCETGIPFLRGLNLFENEINDDIVYLNESLRNEIGKAIVTEGDILITRSGSVGITAVVDDRQEGYAFGSFMIKLVIDKEMWNPYYISAFLNSFWGKWQIERQKNGAVQQNINLQEIYRILVPKIDLDKQNTFETLIKEYMHKEIESKQLIQEAKQDVEDLIEDNFDMSKLNETTTESR